MICIYRHFVYLFPFIYSNICRYQFLTFIRFQVKQSQGRRSLILRTDKRIWAYLQCSRGNIPLYDATIDTVFKFYREDGISRISASFKDTMEINGQAVAVRFIEMTVLDAYRIFNERFPGAVARSTFYALWSGELKIATPHDTCICIIHENMDLLLKVCVNYTLIRLYGFFIIGVEQSLSKICRHSLLFIQ